MRLNRKIEMMAELPLLRLFEPDALHVLAFSAEERPLKAGEVLFRRDEPAITGFLILSGRIALNGSGHGIEGAEIHGPGVLLGESALLAETRRPANAIAVEPSTVLELPRSLMHKVLEAHPDSAAALRHHVAASIAATEFELKTLLG